MCLAVKKPYKVKIAEKDIECFKVLEKHTYSDGSAKLCTPYQCTVIDKNIINGKNPMISQILVKKEGIWKEVNVTKENFEKIIDPYALLIDRGAIHTFSSITNARKERSWHRARKSGAEYVIYKCIIPKGTLYYEGTFNNVRGFASNKLIFKEEVK